MVSVPVLCIAGLPGSGKSTVSGVLAEMGFRVFVMGDYVRAEAGRMGVSTDEAATRLRVMYGSRAVAKLTLGDVAKFKGGRVAIEGLRSREEYEAFREALGDVRLIFIVASLKTRFSRLASRGRPDDPRDPLDLMVRDYRELAFGLANLISLADYIIVNEGLSIDELRDKVRGIVREVYGD
jgi:dephospho-CoA kinase